jgi:methyltransferase (TIGR00027 family)
MAIAAGVSQIVICGAGYDDRALRFRAPGVRFFELDQPKTQADKARRLREMGANRDALTLVTADFRHDGVAELLRNSGHTADQPSLFVCEGLLVYLDQQVVSRLLGELRSIASPRSTLAASLAFRRMGEESDRTAAVANALHLTGRTEPWLTILTASEYSKLFSQAGWVIGHASEAGGSPSRLLHVTARPTGRI